MLEAIAYLVLGVTLGAAEIAEIRHRSRTARTLVDWWIEEAVTPTGRRRVGFGSWGSEKLRDPDVREGAVRIVAFNLIVILAMGCLIFTVLGISALVRR